MTSSHPSPTAEDLERLFRHLYRVARDSLIGRRGLSVAHLHAFDAVGNVTVYALDLTLFDPNGTKQRLARDLRASLKQRGITHYGFLTEVWIATRAVEDGKGDLAPSQDPDRQEALMSIVGTRLGGSVRLYRLERDAKGLIRKLIRWSDLESNNDGGRFGHLLTDHGWSEPTLPLTDLPRAPTRH